MFLNEVTIISNVSSAGIKHRVMAHLYLWLLLKPREEKDSKPSGHVCIGIWHFVEGERPVTQKTRTGAVALTEPAVVLSGPVHRPVGEDLQLEAGATVQLSPAQDALQVAKIRKRSALQSALDQTQSLVQSVRQRHVPQCWKSLQIQIDAAEKSSHLCHDEKRARSQTGEERDAHFICDLTHLYRHPYPPRATPGWQLYLLHVSSNFQLWCLQSVCDPSAVRKRTFRSPKSVEHRWQTRERQAVGAREALLTVCPCFWSSDGHLGLNHRARAHAHCAASHCWSFWLCLKNQLAVYLGSTVLSACARSRVHNCCVSTYKLHLRNMEIWQPFHGHQCVLHLWHHASTQTFSACMYIVGMPKISSHHRSVQLLWGIVCSEQVTKTPLWASQVQHFCVVLIDTWRDF